MAISESQIVLRRSTTAGSAGNTTTQANINACLGKFVSTTATPSGLNSMFPDLSGDDNANLAARYACHFVVNTASQTAQVSRVYLDGGDPPGGATVQIALDPTPASPIGSSSAQALTAASNTAPGASVTGLAWSAPSSDAAGLVLGDLPAGYCRAIWVRVVGAAASSAVLEQIVLKCGFDTAP